MPFTSDQNRYYSITVMLAGQDRRGFHATAEIWRRDRPETVGEVHNGWGRTLIAAEQQAYAAARRACPSARPDDWGGLDDET